MHLGVAAEKPVDALLGGQIHTAESHSAKASPLSTGAAWHFGAARVWHFGAARGWHFGAARSIIRTHLALKVPPL